MASAQVYMAKYYIMRPLIALWQMAILFRIISHFFVMISTFDVITRHGEHIESVSNVRNKGADSRKSCECGKSPHKRKWKRQHCHHHQHPRHSLMCTNTKLWSTAVICERGHTDDEWTAKHWRHFDVSQQLRPTNAQQKKNRATTRTRFRVAARQVYSYFAFDDRMQLVADDFRGWRSIWFTNCAEL